jgi:predicted DNA-binding protein with PD1-like motif
MQTRRIHEVAGQATWVMVLETGDEAIDCLTRFAGEAGLDAASFTAIGAFERATLAFFDWELKEYLPIPVEEQVEVASLSGDITLGPDGQPAVHVHAVLGRRDGSALAGHLKAGVVRPTLELVLTESPGALRKRVDAESGVALIRV